MKFNQAFSPYYFATNAWNTSQAIKINADTHLHNLEKVNLIKAIYISASTISEYTFKIERNNVKINGTTLLPW